MAKARAGGTGLAATGVSPGLGAPSKNITQVVAAPAL
jgi:hypothetical protein